MLSGQSECHVGLTQLPEAKKLYGEREEKKEKVNEKESRLSQTDGRSEQQINYSQVEKREKARESGRRRENEMRSN